MPVKYLADLKEVVAVLYQIDPEAVVFYSQNDLVVLTASPQVYFRFPVRVMVFQGGANEVMEYAGEILGGIADHRRVFKVGGDLRSEATDLGLKSGHGPAHALF